MTTNIELESLATTIRNAEGVIRFKRDADNVIVGVSIGKVPGGEYRKLGTHGAGWMPPVQAAERMREIVVAIPDKSRPTFHTPGPWTNDDDGMIRAEMESLGKFFSVTVADPHADKLDPDEREANARLIAAAPELLACLLDVLDADGDIYAMDFDRYRAAIAKAEGHASAASA